VSKKRILMVGSVDFSIDNAPKIHFSNLAREFSNLDANVLCIVYAPTKRIIDSAIKKFRVSFAPNPLIGNFFSRTLKYLLLAPIILWYFFNFSPNIIYFRFSPPAFIYLLILKVLKIFPNRFKIILELNSWVPEEREIQGESKLKVKLIKILQLKSVFLSDYIRVVAPGIKERLICYGIDAEKIAVVGNGTDTAHFRPINKKEAKKKLGLDPDCLYIGFIGNFAIWQGLDCLIQEIPEILKANKNIRFLLVGDGPLMPKIKKEVSEFEERKVILTGSIPYQKAILYINAFDIGVAPFIKERNESIGLSPLKVWDYAACGIPIVTTRIRGLEVVEKYSFGILVQPENTEALSEAIIKLIKNSNLRSQMGRNGRKLAEERLSWENVAGQILQMVEN
jgi:glycosyltransferase involved in cell wall biosynthesis